MPGEEVFFAKSLNYVTVAPEYWIGNGISGVLFLIGIIIAARTIRNYLGGKEMIGAIKLWIASGFVFVLLHEVAEIVCISGLHGGFPETLWGHIHIYLFQPLGGLMYLLASVILFKKMKKLTG